MLRRTRGGLYMGTLTCICNLASLHLEMDRPTLALPLASFGISGAQVIDKLGQARIVVVAKVIDTWTCLLETSSRTVRVLS